MVEIFYPLLFVESIAIILYTYFNFIRYIFFVLTETSWFIPIIES